MRGYLTDGEVARELRMHRRTIQRWCAQGKLRGATKAGRSWRIPPRALREVKLGDALEGDDAARVLRHAILVCEEFRMDLAAERNRGGMPPAAKRDWRPVADQIGRLRAVTEDLPKQASEVPRALTLGGDVGSRLFPP